MTEDSQKPTTSNAPEERVPKSAKRPIGDFETNFRPFLRQLEAISECESNSEEKVRVWCIDLLKAALGYDERNLDYELSAVNRRIDIAVKHEGKVILVIECKRPGKLPANALGAAVNYAMARSCTLGSCDEWPDLATPSSYAR